jgi:FO synthase
MFAIRAAAREVPRAHPGSHRAELPGQAGHRDARMPDAELEDDLAATVAVARLVLGPGCGSRPRRTSIGEEYRDAHRAGIDDWGGVSPLTPDHVNPERPWPQIDELAASPRGRLQLRERLTVYPQYVRSASRGSTRGCCRTSRAGRPGHRLGGRGRSRSACPGRSPTAEWLAPAAPTCTPRSTPRAAPTDRRSDFDEVYGDWVGAAREAAAAHPPVAVAPSVDPRCARAAAPPPRPGRAHRRPGPGLLNAEGPAWTRCRLADACAATSSATTSPTSSTATSTSPTSATPAAGSARSPSAAPTPTRYTLSLEQVGDRADEAWNVGATEVCMQGGIHPDLPGTAYFDIAREVKARRAGHARARVLPMEVVNGARAPGCRSATG